MPRGLTVKNRAPDDEFFNISKTIKLSEGLLAQLQERKRKTDVPIATQIRRAIEGYLAQTAEPESKSANTATLELEPEQFAKLTELADSLGMPEVEFLLRHMARRALKANPRELHAFLYGDFFKDGEQLYDEKMEELKGKKGRKTAANDAAA